MEHQLMAVQSHDQSGVKVMSLTGVANRAIGC